MSNTPSTWSLPRDIKSPSTQCKSSSFEFESHIKGHARYIWDVGVINHSIGEVWATLRTLRPHQHENCEVVIIITNSQFIDSSRRLFMNAANHAKAIPAIPDPLTHERSDKPLVHLSDKSIDLVLPVAEITSLDEVLELAGAETTVGVAELEGPQEVGGLLEVGPDSGNLVDEILNADDAVLAEVLLDDSVVGQGDTLLVDFAVSTLVDELLDALEVGVAVGDPGLDDLDHL